MKKLIWLFSLMIFAVACQEDQLAKKDRASSDAKVHAASIECTEGATVDVVVNETVTGTLTISDASSDIEFDFDLTSDEYFLLSDSAWAGDCQAPTLVHSDKFNADDEVRLHSFAISLANLPDCGCVNVKAEVARYNARTSAVETFIYELKVEYCKCPDDKLRTQTMGGWGAVPRGNNPGVYLHANFDEAFPDGIEVGCDYTISLTSAQAVTDFLPNSGEPVALTQNYVNSGALPANTLAGQVVALTLSIGFDANDPDFGEASSNLADAVVKSGTFTGWTVAAVLAEAEKVLGGCASTYSASELNDTVAKINESFDNGAANTGFLDVQ